MNKNWSYPLWWWLCCCSKEDKWWLQTMINPKWTVSVSAWAGKKACSEESVRRQFMESEDTLLRAAVRGPPGDTEAPRDQQQAEAITISSPEEGRAGTVLEGSSKSWAIEKSHLKEAVLEGQRHCQNYRVKQGKGCGGSALPSLISCQSFLCADSNHKPEVKGVWPVPLVELIEVSPLYPAWADISAENG